MHWNNHSIHVMITCQFAFRHTYIPYHTYLIEHFLLSEEHEHWYCIHLTPGDCTLKKEDSWNRSVSSMVAVISISTHPCLKSNRWVILLFIDRKSYTDRNSKQNQLLVCGQNCGVFLAGPLLILIWLCFTA